MRYRQLVKCLGLVVFVLLLSSCGGGGGGGGAPPSDASLTYSYYVDVARGDDGNPGTAAAPFRTITRASTVAGAGDTVKVAPGTYDTTSGEAFPITLPSRCELIGDLGGPISSTRIVGDGPIPGEVSARASLIVGEGARVTGFEISVGYEPLTFGILARNVTAVVDGNRFSAGYGGIRLDGTGDTTVANNRFDTGSYGVIGTGVTGRPLVVNNEFGTISLPLDFSGSPIIRGNTITGNGMVGIQIQNGSPLIEQNMFTHASGYTYGAVRCGGTPRLRGNVFDVGGLSLRIDMGGIPDLGTPEDPGGNRFLAGGVAVSLEHAAAISAVGNTWFNTPLRCGVDIVVIVDGGEVVWGTGGGERCP